MVDLLGIEGSLGARQVGGRASRRKSLRGTLGEGICHAWGPSRNVGGAAPASLLAPDFIVVQNSNVNV
jgi:hypothetical protein